MHRVLIVTDDLDVADLLQFVFSADGHEVALASDTASAVERGLAFRPTVALIDVDLGEGEPGPGRDTRCRGEGYGVAERLRGALGSDVFLIVHTGYWLNDIRTRARAAGFDAYLGKPTNLDELRALLTDLRKAERLLADPPGHD